jgi:molybdate transport system substrate-binding protein
MSVEQETGEPIRGICSMAMRHVLADLAAAYEKQSGTTIAITAMGGVDAARRVEAADPFDFVVLAADAIERLARSGSVDAASRTDLARSGVALAIPAGAVRPDISNESAVRDAVMRARRVGYSTGPSGQYLLRLFERWGIADAIASRMVQAAPGVAVGTLLARGEIDVGFQQLSELVHVPGIDVVGPLPPEIQLMTTFSGAVCVVSKQHAATVTFLSFLASPTADRAKRREGMEPTHTDP